MCLFSRDNPYTQGLAYKLGVEKFDCGICPECLAKKARLWALRCSAESQYNRGVMVTLTYDDYKYCNGRIVGELPPKKLLCNVRHCQLFLKRLRKHFNGVKIKYLLTAEHGSRTGRAHYHAILFGVDFKDRVPYKKSKRGNLIYKSETLTKLWSHGICTIDAVNITGQVARYCTKYCAKDSRCDDTFMLMSRGIGDKWLLENFNGKSYILDGVEYPIPKLIWNRYIQNKIDRNFNGKRSWIVDNVKYHIPYNFDFYGLKGREIREAGYLKYAIEERFYEKNRKIYNFCRKYPFLKSINNKYRSVQWFYDKNQNNIYIAEKLFLLCSRIRNLFNKIKRANPLFQAYLQYWQKKAEIYELNKPSDLDRIKALKDDKYFFYKQKAIRAKLQEELYGRCIIPRSGKKSLVKFGCWKYICPAPLVNKGQMTPKNDNDFIKTAYWSEKVRDFIYFRPVKVK